MASVWRAVVAGLTVAGWAEKDGAYYDLMVTADGSAVTTVVTTPQ